MMNSRRRVWGCCLVLALAASGGCARDGAYVPQRSLKDTPEPSAATLPAGPRARSASRPVVKRILPRSAAKTEAPQAPVRSATAAPLAPQPAPAPIEAPAKTGAPQQVTPAPKAPPSASSAQQARRPPISGPQLLEEGRMLFKSGEVLAARERYVAALSTPLPDVLLELARTYDPNYLDRLPKTDADADLERARARALYEQATSLGSKLAEQDLARLQGTAAPQPPAPTPR